MSQYPMTPLPSRDEPRLSALADGMRALRDEPLRRAVAGYLLLLLALLPLPFGGWRDWAIDIVALLTAGFLLAVAIAALAGRTGLGRLSVAAVPAALYAGVLIWAALQASDLAVLQPFWHPIWGEAEAALGQRLSPSITLDRFETGRGLVSLGSYAGIFMLALYAIADLRVARMTVSLFIYAAAAYALYGLALHFTGAAVVLWFEKADIYRDVLTSTFDNRNNFATYAGMALIAALGLFLNEVSRRRQTPTRQAAIVVVDRIWRMTWPLIVAAAILATALMMTASRAGMVAALAGVAVLCCVTFLTPRIGPFRPRSLFVVWVALAVLLVVFSGDQATQRIVVGLDSEEERFLVYPGVMQGIRDYFWVGTGLGSFEDSYRFYRDAAVQGRFTVAHNDPLEAALELGVPATAAMLLAVVWLVGLCWRELRARRRGAVLPCIAVAVSFQVGLHSLVDFSMQVPAVAIAYLILLACGLTRADRPLAERPAAQRSEAQ